MDTVFQTISIRATEEFNPASMRVGDLVGTTELGNNTITYKIFKINADATVEICLPDLVMHTVPVSSLYKGVDARRLYNEHVVIG